VNISISVLFGATAAQSHGIDELKVARVKAKGYVQFLARASRPVAAISHVILYVPATAKHLGIRIIE
jgi:hypothetical protein